MYPALYLYPLNDSFIPKHIALLPGGQRVKVGRQTNAKTVPAERNGYFDSKVLSRQHAEVWEEGGKIYIKDVKSSNGTFINGERLSPEGLESDPFELKTDDIVEFGIDIVGEDNKTIIHHKVAARVVCVFNEADAAAAARAEHSQQSQANMAGHNQAGPSGAGGGGFNFAGGQGGPGTQRRPALQPQGLGGMGGMGGSMRPPGKSGLTFDHIISRLQGELQKSRETGAELSTLTGAMNDIHDTLGGAVPPTLPPYPQNLPPVRPATASTSTRSEGASSDSGVSNVSSAALNELQAQLAETQTSLAGHVDKVRALEGVFDEHEAIKREVSALRETMEERRRELESLRAASPPSRHYTGRGARHDEHESDGESEFLSDDEDARSIATVVPHELARVDEDDEDALAADEDEDERRRRREELGRPRTPEPTGMGMVGARRRKAYAANGGLDRSPSPSSAASAPTSAPAIPDELTARLTTLSTQLESALALSRSLQAQHTQAQDTISTLESRVASLEGRVHATQAEVAAQADAVGAVEAQVAAVAAAVDSAPAREQEQQSTRESLTAMVTEWKRHVEGRWGGVQEEWDAERERLRRAKDDWERRVRKTEGDVRAAVGRLEEGLERVEAWGREAARTHAHDHDEEHEHGMNGDAKHGRSVGLVTPPSPRSLSSDSARSRQRRRRGSSSRGRASRSRSKDADGEHLSTVNGNGNGNAVRASGSTGSNDSALTRSESDTLVDSPTRARAPWNAGEDEEDEEDVKSPPQYPLTPKASFDEEAAQQRAAKASSSSSLAKPLQPPDLHLVQYRAAAGMVLLSVVTAAVLYRVKPDLAG